MLLVRATVPQRSMLVALLTKLIVSLRSGWAGCNVYVKFFPENMTLERLYDLFSKFGTTGMPLSSS